MRTSILATALSLLLAGAAEAAFYIEMERERVREGETARFIVRRTTTDTIQTIRWVVEARQEVPTSWGTLTFAIGESRKEIAVQTIDDDVFRYDIVGCQLLLYPATGGPFFDGAVIAVEDDEPAVYHKLRGYPRTVSEGLGAFDVTMGRSGSLATTTKAVVELRYHHSRTVITSRVVEFPPGATTATATFPIENDDWYVGAYKDYDLACYGVGQERQVDYAEVRVTEDEPHPRLAGPVQHITVTETDGDQLVPVTLTSISGFLFGRNVPVESYDETAGAADYSVPAVIAWPARQTVATLMVTIKGDDTAESDETFRVRLQDMGVFDVTIVDDDRPPFAVEFSSPSYEFNEGDATIVVRRTGQTSGAAHATIHIRPRTPVDWPGPIEVSFAPGETTRTVTFSTDDGHYTGARAARLELEWEGFTGAFADLRIVDDEPMPSLSISGTSVREGDPGESRRAVFELSLTGPAGVPLAVGVATEHGSANGDDYVPMTGTVSFVTGHTTARAEVVVRGDGAQETDETFTLRITSCCGGVAQLANDSAVGIIKNDDGGDSSTYRVQSAARALERDRWLEAAVTRTDTAAAASVSVRLVGEAPRTFSPVTVRFKAGEQTKNVRFYIDDGIYSGDANARLEVSAGTRVDHQQDVQLVEDEPRSAIRVHDLSIVKGPAPAVAVFRVSIEPPTWKAIQLHATTSGPAPSSGYEQVNRTVTIPAGARGIDVPVGVTNVFSPFSDAEFEFWLRIAPLTPSVAPPKEVGRCKVRLTREHYVATVGPYDPLVAAGSTRPITIKFAAPTLLPETFALTSSHPEIVAVPQSLPLPPGVSSITFDAAGVAPGDATVTVRLPGAFSHQELAVPLSVYTARTPVATPHMVVLLTGETARVSLWSLPSAGPTIRAMVQAADPAIVFAEHEAVIGPGATATFALYGANPGKTELLITFPAEHGGTTLRIPVEVIDAPSRRRGVGK